MPASANPSKTALFCAILVLVTVAVFLPSVLRDQFVNWDDEGQLYQNPDFNPATISSVAKYWYRPHMNLYMPVAYTLWGGVAVLARTLPDAEAIELDPRWFHGLNLLLHCGAAVAVFWLLRALVEAEWA